MKALVTGGGGFIGSHLCESLIERGYTVRAFVRYNSRNLWGWLDESKYKNEIDVFAGDIRNYDSVKRALDSVDKIFHLAALIGIPYSYHSPDAYVDTNIRGTLNILQAARELCVKRIVHTSTSEIYGTAQHVPIPETHPVNPQSPYAASKSAADLMALSFWRSFDLPVVIIRPFNTYGPRQSARAVIPTIISQILNGKRKIRLGSLYPTRDFTYVEDTVAGFIAAAQSKKGTGEVINLGNNSEISIGELVKLTARLLKKKVAVDPDMQRMRPQQSEVERLCADNSKARELLGWRPKITLEEGLLRTIKWFKENRGIYKPDVYNI